MAFRFQKRIKVLPGVTLNLSKKGVSTSLGPRGAKVTLGHGQTRVTTGIPGTGLSHTTVVKNKPQQALHTSYDDAPYIPTPARKPRPESYTLGRGIAEAVKMAIKHPFITIGTALIIAALPRIFAKLGL